MLFKTFVGFILIVLAMPALAIAPAPSAGSFGVLPLAGIALLGAVGIVRYFNSKKDK